MNLKDKVIKLTREAELKQTHQGALDEVLVALRRSFSHRSGKWAFKVAPCVPLHMSVVIVSNTMMIIFDKNNDEMTIEKVQIYLRSEDLVFKDASNAGERYLSVSAAELAMPGIIRSLAMNVFNLDQDLHWCLCAGKF